ncbi:pyruvate dehydrogenase (acetyl-transferring), homodimeric type [Pelagibaculum spongiae]|uniref:Pyruvate dehydrogenase E1 component n=1 Tax=Pelagibaculum spongiae TaxID=2080658 RepID=A0A2V1GXG0_9GAMM|nr:pyruvate dehydrogenase (acetyl-transferring), homodimeric type [Pelagibaculum spongiae]PVZ68954.1 pyruvate dehydrogenase (acetyl-transferring), homodimeric type [Pelagibaculum spongiae]
MSGSNHSDFENEFTEWQEALDDYKKHHGKELTRQLILRLQQHLLDQGDSESASILQTPYLNSIPHSKQPPYPGDLELEHKLENIIRWNSIAIVLKAADSGLGLGGHISTYLSASTMMEVGLNHIFQCQNEQYGGDTVIFQPHAAPGVYARAFVEGRLSEAQLLDFRRQLQPSGGLSSYPHPRQMPEFWSIPCASMGLSTPTAIYMARFERYLENRQLKAKDGGKTWCFIGDGESDEPEVLGSIRMASREQLNNLVLVVNCNLQRLDGPVRGNGKIIQELERSFLGCDWEVIKVIWGSGWDALLDNDHSGLLRQRMEQARDGDYQFFSALSGNAQRELWIGDNPQLKGLMESLSDDEIKQIRRGGQDPSKLFAAYKKAQQSQDKPVVILVKTVKGLGLGSSGQGLNNAHQKKQLKPEERLRIARELGIPLSDQQIIAADFYKPADSDPVMQYLHYRRKRLGGYIPERKLPQQKFSVADLPSQLNNDPSRETSTTAQMVKLLGCLIKDQHIGKNIVPIVPDEARTFGLEALFAKSGIYSPQGQQYTPVDHRSLLPYKESIDGQILQEGICETGAMASFLAAGSAYSRHNIACVPFYFFYSMFGFQRVGDMIWSGADMLCQGFLLGGTAGRTTLNGEGLQHQDGHSPLLAETVPNLNIYDPAFGYELAVIVEDGIRRMGENQPDCLYYLTIYNEKYSAPDLLLTQQIKQQIIRGIYQIESHAESNIHLLASGPIVNQALKASKTLQGVNVWSVTSWSQIYRSLKDKTIKQPNWLKALFPEDAEIILLSDYMQAIPNMIRPWLPKNCQTYGADDFGLCDGRDQLRERLGLNAKSIVDNLRQKPAQR